MCGIFYLFNIKKDYKQSFNSIQHRGPDNSTIKENGNHVLGFHRLAINDLSEAGNQPFFYKDYALLCNGEIYNYKELAQKYNIELNNTCDCSIILPLFHKIGIKSLCQELDGVFAFVICNLKSNDIWAARDPMGVRPLFLGFNEDSMGYCSEAKGLINLFNNIKPIKGGTYLYNFESETYFDYYDLSYLNETKNLALRLENAVKKRMMSDRSIGCLLSGGLDSSAVAYFLSKNTNHQIRTYSIGFKGSPDLEKARIMANFLNSEHHEVIMDEDEVLKEIPKIIWVLETYDITTIRASAGMYFLAKYIKEKGLDTVIFSGEGADELLMGYRYFHLSENSRISRLESLRLLENLYKYDNLRADRTTAYWGLELRVPFLDKDLVKHVFSLPDTTIIPYNQIEKYSLRIELDGKIPDEINWRVKEAFSDGVSDVKRSWHKIIGDFVNSLITDREFEIKKLKYDVKTKEALLYREIFENYNFDSEMIGEYWMPKWSNATDPSARELIL